MHEIGAEQAKVMEQKLQKKRHLKLAGHTSKQKFDSGEYNRRVAECREQFIETLDDDS